MDHNNSVDRNDEEYILLDLDAIPAKVGIPPNAPYVLSGLDTLHPLLIINDKVKLIGEYEETIGTCFVFKDEVKPVAHDNEEPTEANLSTSNPVTRQQKQAPQQVKPVARLQKVLKFRILVED